MPKTVLLLGSGGKEAAIAIAIKESNADIVSWAPHINPGIGELSIGTIEAEYQKKIELIEKWFDKIDLVIIGQVEPMLDGLADWFQDLGKRVFSPNSKNAVIEGSKAYMRDLLSRNNIQGNIEHLICSSRKDVIQFVEKINEVVVKPDGITGGTGVKIYGDHLQDREEVIEYANCLIERDGKVILEKKVSGIEFCLQGLVNGERIIFLPLVKDYKRAFDNDVGPNTGSMGACSFPDHSLPYLTLGETEKAKSIMKHVIKTLKKENGAYIGAISGQFILTNNGVEVIEFNTRFGDPEAINVLTLLKRPLLELIDILFSQEDLPHIDYKKKATCSVYLVPSGFPENPKIGETIEIPITVKKNTRLAYVRKVVNGIETTNKRSLIIIGTGDNINCARKNAYELLKNNFQGLRYRTDIASEF